MLVPQSAHRGVNILIIHKTLNSSWNTVIFHMSQRKTSLEMNKPFDFAFWGLPWVCSSASVCISVLTLFCQYRSFAGAPVRYSTDLLLFMTNKGSHFDWTAAPQRAQVWIIDPESLYVCMTPFTPITQSTYSRESYICKCANYEDVNARVTINYSYFCVVATFLVVNINLNVI